MVAGPPGLAHNRAVARALGIDVGGTFTDFVEVAEDGSLRTWKRLSTPVNPERAIVEGIAGAAAARYVHGSTVATNALLERRGPRVALVTTEGFRDILIIRRQTRPRLYELEPRRSPHVVARGDSVTARERMGATGDAVVELTDGEIEAVVDRCRKLDAEDVAVCLLHSFAYPEHERRLAEALADGGFEVSASIEIAPQVREYERASTTAINAFLRPTIRTYIEKLEKALPGVRVIRSDASLASTQQAGSRPISMLLSGPAGGVLGALSVARLAGIEKIVTFDMGGTSTDVALCPGEPLLRGSMEIDSLTVLASTIDIETVGAGGGSIARLDAGNAMVVGPESAGADPGPACYGKGELPTVTDANLVLGRLRPEQRLGESVAPDIDRARLAMASLGPPEDAARAVIEVVNANMARSLSRVSLERGFDTSEFTLVAFGGAGPLHACALAQQLGFGRVFVPRFPGVLSALGMLTAPEAAERTQGLVLALEPGSDGHLREAAHQLDEEARAEMKTAGAETERTSWSGDARYAGQAHELRVSVAKPTRESFTAALHAAHEQRYGYSRPDATVELVTLRARAEGASPVLELPTIKGAGRRAFAPSGDMLVVERAALAAGDQVRGEASIFQPDATTYLPEGWLATVDKFGNLLMERE